SLDVAPAGMVINAATGLIEWTPTAAQVGAHGVTLRVTDARGQSATQSFSVTVAANGAPVAANDSDSTTFGYRVRDRAGAVSNVATVTVAVR
ncbi:MAG: Ig domain-containing protein, partial [Ramlibacter sp.]